MQNIMKHFFYAYFVQKEKMKKMKIFAQNYELTP